MADPFQLAFDFEAPFAPGENPSLWSPREIWVRINNRMMPHFHEDRRIDFKRGEKVNLEDLAMFQSMYSNTPDGGVIVFGATSAGVPTGCSKMAPSILNAVETCHVQRCPQARPEFKRIPVIVEGAEDFCVVMYVPYIGKLVETNKVEAYIRYGDTCHKMSDEEKRDYRSSRQELSFEMDQAPYAFPKEFDLQIIQDFCDAFRSKEGHPTWSNEEVLVDRHLAEMDGSVLRPNNALVLLAARDPRKTIPGCRVRVQRFATTEEGVGPSYNPIRDRFIEGNLVQIMRGVSEVIGELNYDVTWLNSEGKFVTTPEYPQWAWFEALINACVHRSYSFSGSDITVKFFADRLEIESPGGFVPPVNETTIYKMRSARNPHLMDALRVLGYVRMAREGTRRIQQSMKEWGLPDPIFQQEAVHGVLVRVTLRNDHETRKRATDSDVASFFGVDVWRTLEEHEVKIAAYAFRNKMIQVSEAQRLTGRTWATSKKDLDRLTRRGILEFRAGDYARDPKAHYTLKPRE